MTQASESIESFLERVVVIVNPDFTPDEKMANINNWRELLGKYVKSVKFLKRVRDSEYWCEVPFTSEVRTVIEDLLDSSSCETTTNGVVVLCMENAKVSESTNLNLNASAYVVNKNASVEDQERIMKSLENANIRIECMTNCEIRGGGNIKCSASLLG